MTAGPSATSSGVGVTSPAATLAGLNTTTAGGGNASYSTTYGQALAVNASTGDWIVTSPSTTLSSPTRTYYEEFQVTAGGSYNLRVDSLIFTSAAASTVNGKVGLSYSAPTATPGTTAFTPLEPTGAVLPNSGDPTATPSTSAPQTGPGSFTSPAAIARRNAGPLVNTNTFRIALNGGAGVSVPVGATLRIRLYFALGSASAPRPIFLRDVTAKGQAITNVGVTTTSAQVSFSTPATGGYTYSLTTSPAGGTATLTTAPSSANNYVATYTVSGLTAGTAYTVTAAGTNGAVSTSISTSLTTNAGTCADPTGLGVGSIGQTTAQVSFAQPTNGNTNTGYTLTYYPTATGTPVQTLSLGASATGASLSGLTGNTAYTVTLQSTCPVGTGTLQSTSFATLTCADPTGLSVGSVTGTRAQLSFTPGTSNVSYTVTYYPTGSPGSAVTVAPAPTASPVTLTGLQPVTAYTATLQSTCANGAVGNLLTATFTTGPANSAILEQWPLTTDNQDNAAVRSYAVTATVPTLTGLSLSNGTTDTNYPAYSAIYGQAFSPNANGDGGGWTGNQANASFYEEFTLTASAGNNLRADSLVFVTAVKSTANGKLALAYSLDGFATAGTFILGSALNAPAALTATPTAYRLALPTGGITRTSGQTLTFRFYYNAGTGSVSRYATLRSVYVAGEGFVNGLPNLTVSASQNVPGGTTYGNVTVTSGATATLTGPLTAQGAITVQGGAVLSTNCQPVTGAATFALAAGAELVVCDPAGISVSGSSGAVQSTGNRSFSTDALYTYVGATTAGVNPATGPGLPAAVRTLTVRLASATDTLQLNRDVTIGSATSGGGLTMTRGLLKTYVPTGTPNYLVTMGRGSTLSETSSSFVVGQLRSITLSFVADGNSTSFSNIGLAITAHTTGGASLPGDTYVLRTTGMPAYGAGDGPSIRRQFRIVAATETNLNVDLTVSYLPGELNGNLASTLKLFSRPTVGGAWTNEGGTAGTNQVSQAGLTHLSDWTLSSAAAPLPVQLVAFEAQAQGNAAQLTWRTASELHNQGFAVEASAEGNSFRQLAFVAGAGSSTTARTYHYLDQEAGKQAMRYYRLRQVDADGTSTYSPVRVVRFDATAPARLVELAPNPSRGEVLTLFTRAATAARTTLQLTDALGRTVYQRALEVPAGPAQLPVEGLGALPAGSYTMHLNLDGQPQRLRLLRE